MKDDELIENRRALAIQFESIFGRLLAGEKIDLYEERMSGMFELAAIQLFAETHDRKRHWFDDIDNLTANVRKSRQVEFNGHIWVGEDTNLWMEDFRARVTDKRSTKQGIWLTLWIGSSRAEGELSVAFGFNSGE